MTFKSSLRRHYLPKPKEQGTGSTEAAMFLSPASCFSRRQARPPPTWRGSSTSSCRPRSAAAAAAPRSGDTARLAMETSGMISFHTSLRHYILFRHWRFYSLVTKGKFARKRHSSCLLPQKPGNCCKLGYCYLVPST